MRGNIPSSRLSSTLLDSPEFVFLFLSFKLSILTVIKETSLLIELYFQCKVHIGC